MKIDVKNYISPNGFKKNEKDIAKKLLELGYIDEDFFLENYIFKPFLKEMDLQNKGEKIYSRSFSVSPGIDEEESLINGKQKTPNDSIEIDITPIYDQENDSAQNRTSKNVEKGMAA